MTGLLDSGAFTDPPARRLTAQAALERQLKWEQKASEKWGGPFRSFALSSYDLLIDETWTAGERHKRRWSIADADWAVGETAAAAEYLASKRTELYPRILVLGVQGVDASQYIDCLRDVLQVATPEDWIGLGGWCILGRFTRWLPVFWAAMRSALPLIAQTGIRNVHIYGVLYRPALGGLLWLADQYGLSVSTDSSAPILVCTWKDKHKSGARFPYWRDNVAYWVSALADLRNSPYYREPPAGQAMRQAEMWATI